jgi:sulfate transport system substrate-binding protein
MRSLARYRRLSIAAFIAVAMAFPVSAETALLNVSYDPTRKFYKEFNAAFAEHWKAETGDTVTVHMSHGGSGRQARAVIYGLDADVVTLGLEADIDAIVTETGKIPANWRERLPNQSAPYTSTVVFLVRKGNPKGIADWGDLLKDGVEVITPNPKTSGNGRWSYLGAWAYAAKQFGGNQARTRDFVAALYRKVPVLDTGARGSTTTFVQRGIGDVLLTWENEAFLALEEFGAEQFDIVVPSTSIDAVPPVALVDGNVDAKGTRKAAEAYLRYLYSPAGQALAAKHFYRPSNPQLVDPADLERFPDLKLMSIDDPLFGGWAKVQPTHFDDGGVFDQIYDPQG